MSYADVNTPVIERITLPSGNTYYIADREIRDVVDALSQTVAGGVSFIIAWDGTDTPVVAQIPSGVKVTYNDIEYTGTLSAETTGSGAHAQAGAFYLVKSATSSGNKDVYDEYVPIGAEGSKSWEKIGDTQIELADVVTDVSLSKQTDTVIGSDATFKITQPTVSLATGATAGSGVIGVATGITSVTDPTVALSEESATATGRVAYTKSVSTTKLSASASGAAVSASGDSVTAVTGYASPTSDTVLGTGSTFSVTDPSVTISSGTTGDVTVATGIGNATTRYLSASASGAAVSASGDSVTALTGLGTPTTSNVASSVTPTTKKLSTTTVTGVSGSTNITPVESRTSQTTADGTGTASSTNTDWLKGVSVSNGVLSIGAATLDTQTTYSAGAPRASLAVPTAASSATTVATGSVTTTGSGADIVTDVAVGDTVAAVTGYASPTTDTVLGTGSTFNVTQPTVSLTANTETGTGRITYVQAQGTATTTKLAASASGGAVSASGDEVTALTGLGSPTTDTVLGTSSTFNVTQPTITVATGSSGDVTVATGGTTKYMAAAASGTAVTPTTTNIKATASGAKTEWNSKDQVTVLTNATDVSVTKGSV